MNQTPDGTLWMWEIDKRYKSGLRPARGVLRRIEGDAGPGTHPILVDREGEFWMSVNDPDGLRRVSNLERLPDARIASASSLVQKFTHKEGLTGDLVRSALQDHEGNVWVATVGGLDRFRRKNVIQGPFPSSHERRTDAVLMTDQKGIVWEGSRPIADDGGARWGIGCRRLS